MVLGLPEFLEISNCRCVAKVPAVTGGDAKEFDQIIAGMKSATMTNDPSLIEFENTSVSKSFNRHQNWKARLDADKAFFLGEGGTIELISGPGSKGLPFMENSRKAQC